MKASASLLFCGLLIGVSFTEGAARFRYSQGKPVRGQRQSQRGPPPGGRFPQPPRPNAANPAVPPQTQPSRGRVPQDQRPNVANQAAVKPKPSGGGLEKPRFVVPASAPPAGGAAAPIGGGQVSSAARRPPMYPPSGPRAQGTGPGRTHPLTRPGSAGGPPPQGTSAASGRTQTGQSAPGATAAGSPSQTPPGAQRGAQAGKPPASNAAASPAAKGRPPQTSQRAAASGTGRTPGSSAKRQQPTKGPSSGTKSSKPQLTPAEKAYYRAVLENILYPKPPPVQQVPNYSYQQQASGTCSDNGCTCTQVSCQQNSDSQVAAPYSGCPEDYNCCCEQQSAFFWR